MYLAEKTLVSLSNIRSLTTQYLGKNLVAHSDARLSLLTERSVIWIQSQIEDVETSKITTEVWIVTPDLKPDVQEKSVAGMVKKNLRDGKKYIYFVPDDLPQLDAGEGRLLKFTGVIDSRSQKIRDRVEIIRVNKTKYPTLFAGGNIILFFRDEKRMFLPKCFEEIQFTQIADRGKFWQEHSESKTQELQHLLEQAINEINAR